MRADCKPDRWAEAARLREQGLTLREIGAAMGVSAGRASQLVNLALAAAADSDEQENPEARRTRIIAHLLRVDEGEIETVLNRWRAMGLLKACRPVPPRRSWRDLYCQTPSPNTGRPS